MMATLTLEERAHGIFALARERAIDIALLGGMGIRILLGPRLLPAFEREIGDLDFITTRRCARQVEQLLTGAGWEPAERFNALNGHRRMLFHEPDRSGRQVDVFVDAFEMCHKLPLSERIDGAGPLPAADLLMTKLQIVELNAKDRSDLFALLAGLHVAVTDVGAINGARIAELCARDWGLHHTFERNLSHLLDALPALDVDEGPRARVEDNIQRLLNAMETAPKSRGWRLRAKVGERKRWYEDVEEVQR